MGASDVLSVMRPGPKVSIVIPARNASQTIAETLSSLSEQTFSNWEAVIVDDGSVDGTRGIAESYAASDARFRVVAQPPQGVSAARNKGIDLARSDWLLFLDSDDWVLPRHLERLTSVLDRDPELDVVYCGWARVAPDGTIASQQRATEADALFPLLARGPVFAVHACIVRRSLVQSAGGFDSAFSPARIGICGSRLREREHVLHPFPTYSPTTVCARALPHSMLTGCWSRDCESLR